MSNETTTEKRPQRPILQTPQGTAIWPRVNEPDTKFKPEGEYNIKLALDEEDASGLLEQIEAAAQEAEAEAKEKFKAIPAPKRKGKNVEELSRSYEPEIRGEGDAAEETGRLLFNFKSTASGVSKKTGKPWQRRIPIFDGVGQPTTVEVRGGFIVICAYTVQPWVNPKCEYGVKLQLEAVQIVEAKSFARDAGAFGFGTVAGGFAAAAEGDSYGDDEADDDQDDSMPVDF